MTAQKREENPELNVDFITADALTIEMEPADLILCYYTVQFINPSARQTLIDKLYQTLNWGGALLLFEKVRGADARFQDILTALYTDYKLRMGYSAEDIVSKSRSLKGVLEPFSTQGNIDMLKRAGFDGLIVSGKADRSVYLFISGGKATLEDATDIHFHV